LGDAERTCTGCGARRSKRELIRIGSDGWTVTRGEVKLSGRGAYVCPDERCIELARRRGRMDRVLRVKVPEELYEQVELLSRESR
jgi:uncharacterized protein